MSAHALLAPSAAHRWMRCTGSVAACGEPTDDSNKYAREGTAAHELGEMALTYAEEGRRASFWIGETIEVPYVEDGVEKVQTFVVDDEMAEHVQVYVDQVLREPGELIVEERLSMVPVYGVKDQFGTADAVKLDYENARLYVGDLKYGRGDMVYAEANEQLYSYAAAAFMHFDVLCEWQTITVAIHQPRLHHYDEHTLTRAEMLAFIEYAKQQAGEAMKLLDETAEVVERHLVPGESQCKWCPVKGSCRRLAEWAHAQVFDGFDTITDETLGGDDVKHPAELTEQELAAIWRRRDTISSWLSEIQSEAKRRLESGMQLPGLKLVAGRAGRRQWEDEEAAAERLKKARLKQDEMYSKKLITPPQAEKVLKKRKPRVWSSLQKLIVQKEGAPAVALESDSRPTLEVAKEDQFEDISGDDFSDLTG